MDDESDENKENPPQKESKGYLCIVYILVAIGVLVVVFVGFSLTGKKDDGTDPPNLSPPMDTPTHSPTSLRPSSAPSSQPTLTPTTPTAAPSAMPSEERIVQIQKYLIAEGIATEEDLLNLRSPQQMALEWLAVSDRSGLQVPDGDKSTTEGYEFMTRYVLAVLYYYTMGDEWEYSLNFLSPFTACSWFSVLEFSDGEQEFRGVDCSDDGKIQALYLGTSSVLCKVP